MQPTKRKILVSVSGGRSSHYMARRMQLDPAYAGDNLLFIYANTGKERLETLDFVHECDQAWQMGIVWVEAKVNPIYRQPTLYTVVNYHVARRHGEPFEAVIRKYGIPNRNYPHCTRELKLAPIHSYARDHFKGQLYITAIGIRADEARRIKISDDKIYPLVEWGVKVETVRRWWQTQPFDLKLRDYEGNCDLCWKKSQRKLLTLISEQPKAHRWWAQMEEWYSHKELDTREKGQPPYYFNRMNVPVVDLVKLAKEGGFESVTDPYWDQEEPCACMLQDYEEVI